MDFAESDEHALLRRAVADVAGEFGHDYFAARVREGGKVDELWARARGRTGSSACTSPSATGAAARGSASSPSSARRSPRRAARC